MIPSLSLDMPAEYPAYRSKTEQAFAEMAVALMAAVMGDSIAVLLYEPLTFKLPGGSYTPDFMALTDGGDVAFIEVKGSTRQKNYRDARSKLRAAAELHPWFKFYEARPLRGHNWDIERIG